MASMLIADDDFRLRKLLLTYTQMETLQFMERSCIKSSTPGRRARWTIGKYLRS